MQLALPELVILPLLLPALDFVPRTLLLLILLLPHVGRVLAGHVIDLMDALVTGRNILNFRLVFVHVVPNLNLETGFRSRNTLVRLSSYLTLLVIIIASKVPRVYLHLLLSRPK